MIIIGLDCLIIVLIVKLGFDFNLDFKTEEQRQFIKIKIDKPTGEFFQDPLYLSFSGQEVFSANVIYDIEKQQISVKNTSLQNDSYVIYVDESISFGSEKIFKSL